MKKILLLFILLYANALHSMEKEENASAFEIYHLLTFTIKNNPEFNLPPELVQTIVITVSEIIFAKIREDLEYSLRQCHTLPPTYYKHTQKPSDDDLCRCSIW